MSQNYDGSVSLKVKADVDTKQSEQQVKSLKDCFVENFQIMGNSLKRIPNAFKGVKKATQDVATEVGKIDFKKVKGEEKLQKLQMDLEKSEKQSASLRSEIEKLSNAKIESDDFKILKQDAEWTNKEIIKLQGQLEKANPRSEKYAELAQKLSEARQYSASLRQEMAQMKASGTDMTPNVNTAKLDTLKQKLQESEFKTQTLRTKISELNAQQSTNEPTAGVHRFAESLKSGASKVSGFASKVKAVFSTLSSFKGQGSGAVDSVGKSFSKGFKNILKWGFGIKSLFILVKKLKQVCMDGLTTMGRQVPEVGQTLQQLSNALKALKASLATAFQPILSVVSPILTKLMSILTSVINTIGEFMAALTGQKYIVKATKATGDYAAASKKAADAQKQLYQNGLDTFNNYTDQSKAASDVTDSGGGLAGVTYEKQDISASVQEYVKALKDSWEKADFTWLGKALGTKLKEALEAIPWPDIKQAAAKVGKSLGTLINGFVSVDGLAQTIGNALAQSLNTIFTLINSFLTNTKWAQVGQFLATGLNSFVDNVDWNLIGTTFGNHFNAVFTTLSNFFSTFNFENLGKSLTTALSTFFKTCDFSGVSSTLSNALAGGMDFVAGLIKGINWKTLPTDIVKKVKEVFKGINWKGMFKSLGNLAGAVLKALFDFAAGCDELFTNVVSDICDYFVKKCKAAGWDKDQSIIEQGKYIIIGIFNGIVDWLKNVGKWIYDNIFSPFLEGFKTAFDIHSPTKDPDLVACGGYIIEGIFNGIINWLASIGTWIYTNIYTPFKNAFSALWSGDVNIGQILVTFFTQTLPAQIASIGGTLGAWFTTNVVTKVINTFSKIGTKIKGFFDAGWTGTKAIFKNAGTYFAGIVTNIKGAFSGIATWFGTTFATAWTKVKNVFSKGGKIFNGIKEGILNGLKTIINGLIEGINKVIKTPFEGINAAIKKIKEVEIFGLYPFNTLSTISVPQIPKLAKGGVIPPNKEFLAILGDQKSGTNIEAPLETIKDGLRQVMSETYASGSGGSYTFTAQIDRKTLFQEVIAEAKMQKSMTGRNPLAYI